MWETLNPSTKKKRLGAKAIGLDPHVQQVTTLDSTASALYKDGDQFNGSANASPLHFSPLRVVDLLLLTAVGWWQAWEAPLGTWRGRETWEN
jgi:hypothetical protein